MFRNTLLTLAVACGMIAGNELTVNKAHAQGQFNFGVAGKNGSFGLSVGGYGPYGYGSGYGYGAGLYGPSVAYYPTTPLLVAPVHVHYVVFYRTCALDPWRTYGTFHSHLQAHQVMNQLRLQGLQTYEAVR